MNSLPQLLSESMQRKDWERASIYLRSIQKGEIEQSDIVCYINLCFSERKWSELILLFEMLPDCSVSAKEMVAIAYFELRSFQQAFRIYCSLLSCEAREEYVFGAVTALFESRNHRDALLFIFKNRRIVIDKVKFLYFCALAFSELQKYRQAMYFLNLYARRSAPLTESVAVIYLHCAISSGRYNDAEKFVEQNDPPKTFNVISLLKILYDRIGRKDQVESLISSIELTDDSELLRIKADYLASVKRFEDAGPFYQKLITISDKQDNFLKSAFAVFVEAGLYDDAVVTGAELVSRFPNDSALCETLRIVIDRRDQKISRLGDNGASRQLSQKKTKVVSSHQYHGQTGGKGILNNVVSLLVRETKTRFGKSKLGYVWVVFEPLAHISIMIALVTTFAKGRLPPVGTSFALFYFTGVLPYYLMSSTVSHVMKAVPENRPLLQLPIVRMFDVYLARALLELMTITVVATVLLFSFYLFGLNVVPRNFFGVISPMLSLWCFSFGLGLIYSVVVVFFPGWERIWGAIISLIYFSSGIFYTARMMPEIVRDYLAFNPLLQAIELIRDGFFFGAPAHWIDSEYFYLTAFCTLSLGLGVVKLYERRILEVE